MKILFEKTERWWRIDDLFSLQSYITIFGTTTSSGAVRTEIKRSLTVLKVPWHHNNDVILLTDEIQPLNQGPSVSIRPVITENKLSENNLEVSCRCVVDIMFTGFFRKDKQLTNDHFTLGFSLSSSSVSRNSESSCFATLFPCFAILTKSVSRWRGF